MTYPSLTNVTGPFKIIEYANMVSGNWLTTLFMIASTLIIFATMLYKGYRTSDSFLIGFFLSTVLGSFFWAAGILAGKIMVIFLILIIVCGIWSWLDS